MNGMDLDEDEKAALLQAVENYDPAVQAAVQVYAQTSDLEELQDTLRVVAQARAVNMNAADEGNQGSASSAGMADESQVLESTLEMLLETNELTAEQGDFLRELHNNRDMMVNAALEVYGIDKDTEELCDTLKTITRIRMNASE